MDSNTYMNMNLKVLHAINNKAELQNLYISQMSCEYIRKEINVIIKETRKSVTIGSIIHAKRISSLEVIIFIYKHGTPDGYILSDRLKNAINNYKENNL